MNKMGEHEYIQMIADVLSEEYKLITKSVLTSVMSNGTLKDNGMDVQLASVVLKAMKEYLFFHSYDLTSEEFRKWQKERDPTFDSKTTYKYKKIVSNK